LIVNENIPNHFSPKYINNEKIITHCRVLNK
jgi:hypothetical protein